MYCLSLIWKRRISYASSEISRKENIFGVPFEGLKIHAMNQGSVSMRQHIGIFLAIVGDVYLGKRQVLFTEPAVGLVSVN